MYYILKHIGTKAPDIGKVNHVIEKHHGQILDLSMMPNLALIKVAPGQLQSLKHNLQEWDIFPETSYKVPTTKKSLGRR